MPLDKKVRQEIDRLLVAADEAGLPGARLVEDAARLWKRVRRFIAMGLVAPETDQDAMELACYALQLPARQHRALPIGRFGQVNLRDRADQAAELLVSELSAAASEEVLDRATRLLREMTQRQPAMNEAKLLADAVNLDDFGVLGPIGQAMHLARQGGGIEQVADGCAKRQQYGYWESRLKDGFHFEPVRQMARKRLANTRAAADMLLGELREDEPS